MDLPFGEQTYSANDTQNSRRIIRLLAGFSSFRAGLRGLLGRPAIVPKLNAELRHDVGLGPDQYPNAPIWGHGRIMWWP